MHNDVEIMVTIKAKTSAAVLVFDGDRSIWLPLSQVDVVDDGDKTYVQMPEWLAVDKELV